MLVDCIGMVYVENIIELPWLIQNGAVYEEKEIRQWRDWS